MELDPLPTFGNGSPLPSGEALSQDPQFIAYAVRLLNGSELTDGLTPAQLARVATIGEARSFASNAQIVDEHENSDELYIILSGTVDVWLDPRRIGEGSAPRKIATLHAGQTCGELALLDGGVRSARLTAGATETQLMAFSCLGLLQLCEQDTDIGFRIMRNLAAALALRLRLQDMRLYSD